MKRQILLSCALMAALATQAASYKDTILADNPSGYWRLDQIPPVVLSYATNIGTAVGTGVDLNGVIGNYTHEGLPGAIAGDTDKAMQFVGNGNSRIVVPNSYLLNNGSTFTFECWMNPSCVKGNAQALVVNRSGESGYTIYVNGDGSFGFNISRGSGGGYWNSCVITNTDTVANMVGKWTHIACVFDGLASTYGTQYIYTNGVLAKTVEVANAPFVPNPDGPFVIGDRSFVGLLDEVASYGVALSADKIMAHYQAGTNGTGGYKALVLADAPDGYWRLNETDGFTPAPVLAANLGSLGDLEKGTYDIGCRLQQPGAIVASTNKSAYFDGLKMMQAPAGRALSPAAPFSVEFWAKPAFDYKGQGTAISCPLGGTDRDYGRSGWLFYQGGNGWSWWLGDNAAYTIQMDPTTPVYTTNWYHVVGTYDGTTARLYVNGTEAMNKTGGYSPNATKPVTLGSRYDGYGYQGLLDEVAIYPVVLTPAEVQAHYANGTSASPTETYDSLVLAKNPITYWRLNESSTVSYPGVPNSSFLGSAVDGTVVGTLALSSDTPLVGDSNPCIDFTAGGRIAIPFDRLLNQTNQFSYEVWYKENTGSSGIRCPLWWRDEPVTGDTRGWVHYMWDNWDPAWNGRGVVFQSSDTFTTWNGLGTASLYAQSEWQLLDCTFDGKVKKIYINGVLIAASTNAVLSVKPVQRAVTTISSGSYPWQGLLDEAAIYTNALSADRIQAHYVAARGTQPPAVAPTFRIDAVGGTFFEGGTVKVPTLVLGTPPFAYQWYKGSTAVAGQTTDTLTLTPAKISDSGDYTLQVSNSGGSATSAIATISVVTAPPTVTTQPVSAVRLQGGTVTFSVVVSGSEPFSYQWKSNNVDIAGATAASLTLNNLQPAYSGNYTVKITNTAGSADSQPATLTVLAVGAGSFAAAVVADQPVAYWRLDDTNTTTYAAIDYAGGHNGVYDYSVALDQPGALLGDPNKSAMFTYGGIQVPFSPDLNPYTTFSVECWAKPDINGTLTERPLVSSRNYFLGWAYGYRLVANANDQWQFITGQKTSGFDNLVGGYATNWNTWYHLVGTFTEQTGSKKLYVNGVLAAETTTAVGTFGPNADYSGSGNAGFMDEGIGASALTDPSGYNTFYGNLDEVAFYNYVLTPDQIANHYAIGATPLIDIGKTTDGKIVLTWSTGRLQQSADLKNWTVVTGATSPWTNSTPTDPAKFYRVVTP